MNHVVAAELVGSIMQVSVDVGDAVSPGDMIVVMESMKMEIPVLTEYAGTVLEVAVKPGDVISEGDTIAVVSS